MGLKGDLEYIWFDSGYSFIYKIKETFRSIRYGIQRIWKGYDDRSVWNLDVMLVTYLKNILQDFRKHSMSYPVNIAPDEWDLILARMISLLNEMDKFLLYDKISYTDYKTAKDEFFEIFSDNFEDLWS